MSDATRHNSTLSPLQSQVAAALAAGQTISAAARAAGIHRSTIHNWLQNEPDFRREFDTIRQENLENTRDQLAALQTSALAALQSLLEDPETSAAVRLRAALAILQRQSWTVNQPLPTPAQQPQEPATPRNAPCPCGSGNKFKRCCGEHAPPMPGGFHSKVAA